VTSPFPRDVFVDTSFWFAAIVPEDTNHAPAGHLLLAAARARTRFHASWEVVGETLTLLRYRCGSRAALEFLDEIVPTIQIVAPDPEVRATALEVFRRLTPRRRLSYCDALSFVIVRQTLDDMACLAFDRDFRALGLTVLRAP
jgi:predicted nucleic acid-binding protein